MLGQFPKSPNKFHPTLPSAVGSHVSLMLEGRDKHKEAKEIIEDITDRVMNHIADKLPPEILTKLDVMGTIKDKLYNYINQTYVNMFNRYMVTVEDELLKKVRDFVDREEIRVLQRYTPRDITELLDKIGGTDKFNTGEIEKSIVNMYGHLHGHIQRGINELENETNALLRQKTDVGAFVRGQNAYAIVKCVFRDSPLKPKTVYDVKLSINILDSELISPIIHYQTTVEALIKESIGKHIQELIDKEVQELRDQLMDEGKAELTDTEIMFEKIKRIENYTDDDKEDEKSKRYTILAKRFLDKIEGLRAEIDPDEYDPLNIRENIKKIVDAENIRNRGYNTAVNTLTSILDTSKLGYQVVDNYKNARVCIIREYDETDPAQLPDERFQIKLVYYDQAQINEERRNYDRMMEAFEYEVSKVWDVVMVYYESKKKFKDIKDFEDLYSRLMDSKWKKRHKEAESVPEHIMITELGDEIPSNTLVERSNPTYLVKIENIKKKLKYLREMLVKIHGFQNPVERVVIEERLNYIENKFEEFTYRINPHHLQPGLILEIDVTTTKRKQYMLKNMSNVLNEFLATISRGFMDAAFASFKRRRSTVREDIDQPFGESNRTLTDEAYKGIKSSSETKGSIDISHKKKTVASDLGLKEL
jgi:hypothetical protein